MGGFGRGVLQYAPTDRPASASAIGARHAVPLRPQGDHSPPDGSAVDGGRFGGGRLIANATGRRICIAHSAHPGTFGGKDVFWNASKIVSIAF
jgi:hypothetical protein